jgi:hypothetical protein
VNRAPELQPTVSSRPIECIFFPGLFSISRRRTHYGTRPLSDLHYAAVIDAGSSGSRVYLYAWPSTVAQPPGVPKKAAELLNIQVRNQTKFYKIWLLLIEIEQVKMH